MPTTAGEQLRDFLHVDDVARALVAVAESDLVGAVNIASGRPVTVREIVERLGASSGAPSSWSSALPYAPGDPMVVAADVAKLASTGSRRVASRRGP